MAVMYEPVMSQRIRKSFGDWYENVGMNVAPPPPGPSFCHVVDTGFSFVSEDILHAVMHAERIKSLNLRFNVKRFRSDVGSNLDTVGVI